MSKLKVDQQLIRELSRLLEETGLTEIEISEGERSIRVARTPAVAAAPVPPPPPGPPRDAADPAREAPADSGAGPDGAVRSPMVGTVYRAPQPGDEPFVKVGDTVKEGQTLMIVEAMKVMNPIPAPRAGTVKEILVEDAQPVEYGDVLLILE